MSQRPTKTAHYPIFSWETVPVGFHFGKDGPLMTAAEAEFVASHASFICLEKGHAIKQFNHTEDGIEQEARQLKRINPDIKVIFYWNTFLDYRMFRAHDEYQKHPQWWLRTSDGQLDKKNDTLKRYDLSRPDVRHWWSDVAKIGDDKLIFYNGIRTTPTMRIGNDFAEDTDAVMIEHFGHFNSGSKECMLKDIEEMSRAGKQGKIVVFKAWPGFAWIDRSVMKKPLEEKRTLAAENITFPLAAFLVGAQENCYFIYNWGYRMRHGCLDWYPELDKNLGPPLGDATRTGWVLERDFKYAHVKIDLETKQAHINWDLSK